MLSVCCLFCCAVSHGPSIFISLAFPFNMNMKSIVTKNNTPEWKLCARNMPVSTAQFEISPALSIGIVIGVLSALVCIAFGTTIALKLRKNEQLLRRRLHQQNDSQFDKPFSTRPGNLPIKDKITLPLGVGDLDEMYDDKNPDVVPYNEGMNEYLMVNFV